jgi:hypothetical protein
MNIKKKVYVKESLRTSIRENEWDRSMLDMIGKVVSVDIDSTDSDRWVSVENSTFHISKSDTIELDFLTENRLLTQTTIPSSIEKIILDMKDRLNMIVSEGYRKEDATYLIKKTEELTDGHLSILKSNVTKHINKVLENKLEHLKSIKLRDDFEKMYRDNAFDSLFVNVSEEYEIVRRDVCEKLMSHLRESAQNSLQTHKDELAF